ncbi:helix-turn-helix domain-containing protein [Actinokineospora bangkokensis]|uniref:HTH cro/C1-type domain-containing protein n=1 Tax=Actinokineospora bangkokensis TaxID=1193682 RepID=A0A1Q9LCB0_9PSEU|nr:helix-turn-helix transcriptional regulator [Actinokineospora bangkokensis]OLR89667.1 hypothetical protein BJP25_04735 [Actinokineospora bangkokensis]
MLNGAETPSGEQVTRAVGAELRRTRSRVDCSRAQLADRLGYELHPQTIGAYESGARQVTVTRFVEMCRALGVAAPEVLGSALQRAAIDLELLVLRVDLGSVLADPSAELDALRRWARNRLDQTGGTRVVRLEQAAVREIAAFCGRSPGAMHRILADFTPESPGQHP